VEQRNKIEKTDRHKRTWSWICSWARDRSKTRTTVRAQTGRSTARVILLLGEATEWSSRRSISRGSGMGKDDGANGERLHSREGGVGERNGVCEEEAAWERRRLRGRAREGVVIRAGSRWGWITRLVPPVDASFCRTQMVVTPKKNYRTKQLSPFVLFISCGR
jgi:hypothetical protein